MQFTVPQFIDVEDKVLGPISVRQFVIFLVTAGFIFVELKVFQLVIGIIAGVFTFALAGALAFVKINGRPFHYFVLTVIQSFKEPRLKVWSKESVPGELKHRRMKVTKPKAEAAAPKRLMLSRLAELSLVVDTGGAYREEGEEVVKEELPPPAT